MAGQETMTTRRFSPKPRPDDTAALTALYGVAQEPEDEPTDVPPNEDEESCRDD